MKFLSIFLISFGLLFLSPQKNEIPLEIGAKLPAKLVAKNKSRSINMIFTHTSQMRPFLRKEIKGVDYTIAYDSETREIKYINTKDEDFVTADNLRVGSEIEVKKESFYIIPQIEIRAPATIDGWEPVVGNDAEDIDFKPNFVDKLKDGETTKVKITGFSKGGN
ncbi:MAG TPA: hypothetical protein VF599_12930 [Pyrinomonadaceae bacterium]|jgi:hypothetical protein